MLRGDTEFAISHMHPAEGSSKETSDKCYEAPLFEIPLAVQNADMLDLLSVGDHCCRNCSGMQFILVPAPPQTNR